MFFQNCQIISFYINLKKSERSLSCSFTKQTVCGFSNAIASNSVIIAEAQIFEKKCLFLDNHQIKKSIIEELMLVLVWIHLCIPKYTIISCHKYSSSPQYSQKEVSLIKMLVFGFWYLPSKSVRTIWFEPTPSLFPADFFLRPFSGATKNPWKFNTCFHSSNFTAF